MVMRAQRSCARARALSKVAGHHDVLAFELKRMRTSCRIVASPSPVRMGRMRTKTRTRSFSCLSSLWCVARAGVDSRGDGEIARGDGSSDTAGDESSLVPVIVEACDGGATGGFFNGSRVEGERGTLAPSTALTRGDGEHAADIFLWGDGELRAHCCPAARCRMLGQAKEAALSTSKIRGPSEARMRA